MGSEGRGGLLRTTDSTMKETVSSATENGPGFLPSCSSTSRLQSSSRYHPYAGKKHIGDNVTRLLSWREVSPTVRPSLRSLWGESVRWSTSCSALRHEATSAKHALISWLEADSLRHCTAKYCPLEPAPRSTIAAAFSPDGTILASSHGDHTVKIICCKTGACLKTLCGHRRTPWVVRFHPIRSDVLASGSLDNEVKLWDANTAACIASHDFYRPIASIAFHAQGDLLAVASGHKLYIWQYNRRGEAALPAIVLRTRRSLRAVHFHPHAAPLLLTAEVNGLDAPDCSMTLATSAGYLQYPRPAIFFTPVEQPLSTRRSENTPVSNPQPYVAAPTWFWPAAWVSDGDIGGAQSENMMVELNGVRHTPVSETENYSAVVDSETQNLGSTTSEVAPMELSPRPSQNELSSLIGPTSVDEATTYIPYTATSSNNFESGVDMLLRAAEGHVLVDEPHSSSPLVGGAERSFPSVTQGLSRSETRDSFLGMNLSTNLSERQVDSAGTYPGTGVWNVSMFSNFNVQVLVGDGMPPLLQQPFQVGDQPGWELPFLQGWVMGQSQAGLVQPTLHPSEDSQPGRLVAPSVPSEARGFQTPQQQQQQRNTGAWLDSAAMAAGIAGIAAARTAVRSGSSRGSRNCGVVQTGSAEPPGLEGVNHIHVGILHGFASRDPNPGIGVAETAAAQAAMAAAAAAELPCTVKLRIWPHDIKHPSAVLDPETCRLTIPHAVLCSEMGAHFSPCGRFLAACVACVLPPLDSDASAHSRAPLNDVLGAGSSATSPTRHPISAQQVIYELRIYSLEEATFGEVLASRAIRAAHCLTSIQFSPSSNHILLAYGRRHSSLLRSIVVNGATTIPIFTILEVYRVSDMELVKVLPSAEDEVNVACFHPIVGGGLAYGTKEGRLRIFKHDRSKKPSGSSRIFQDHVFDFG